MATRRSLLRCLPAVAALGPASAGAFRPEPPTAEVAAEYGAACPPLPSGTPPARCPYCGCAVMGAADHGEAAPPPPLAVIPPQP